jgi:cytochrome P450
MTPSSPAEAAPAAPAPQPDLRSPAFKADPFPYYARLRAERPVCRVELPDRQTGWLITRYDDVLAALKDDRLVKEKSHALSAEQAARQPWVPKFFEPLTRNMLDRDPPDHTRLRALVHKAFTPRRVEAIGARVQELADELLAAARRRAAMDLIADYALPIPTTVIAELLGVPAGDRRRFHRWSSAIVSSDPSGWQMVRALPSAWLFLRYLRRLLRRRRGAPAGDLLSALIEAEEAGQRLDEDELVAMVFLLLVAGHETTVNLIGNGVLALLDHPGELERLVGQRALLDSAIEELLRFDSPVAMATERWAREELTVAGVTIPRGALVYAVLASANRDGQQFPFPDRLDLGREPNRHLAFGQGIHYCLGAPLARLEARIAIATLLRVAPDLRLAVPRAKLRWRRGVVLRGLERLPVAWGA